LEENAERLRRGYAAFAEGDLETATEFFAEDIRWEGPRTNGLPDSGVFHGRDEVRWMFKHVAQTFGEETRVIPDEFVQDGATIVVLGHMDASPGGTPLQVPWVHVWRFEDDSATRVLTLTDTAMVRDALSP
jgi:ketosteroid isomerase-like protein